MSSPPKQTYWKLSGDGSANIWALNQNVRVFKVIVLASQFI